MKPWVIARRISQLIFFTLFIYILWSTTYPLTGLVPPDTFFKINPLIMLITSISERMLLPGIIFSFIMIVLTIVFGRFFCGWICPLGAVIDGVGAFRKNGAGLKKALDAFRFVKFIILGILGICALLSIQLAWVLDPMVIMARFVSLNLIPTITLACNKTFAFVIQEFNLYGGVYDFYRLLKASFLGIKPYYFAHSLILFLFFIMIISTALVIKRFWCRDICPLGALYALCARWSLLTRRVIQCTECKKCISECRMGAIQEDISYRKEECILCMDCVYDCPAQQTIFTFKKNSPSSLPPDNLSLSRRTFLFFLCSSMLYGFRFMKRKSLVYGTKLIRPPGVLNEKIFLNQCIRCGNCMKVCITNGLQPAIFETGLDSLWTPHLVPEIGWCEYNCVLCGNVCPTGAIPRLSVEVKRKIRLGVAKIDQSICLPWAEGKECIVCEEHCPVSEKAIKRKEVWINNKKLSKPWVFEDLCIGCGICQNKCPTIPIRAIRVYP